MEIQTDDAFLKYCTASDGISFRYAMNKRMLDFGFEFVSDWIHNQFVYRSMVFW